MSLSLFAAGTFEFSILFTLLSGLQSRLLDLLCARMVVADQFIQCRVEFVLCGFRLAFPVQHGANILWGVPEFFCKLDLGDPMCVHFAN